MSSAPPKQLATPAHFRGITGGWLSPTDHPPFTRKLPGIFTLAMEWVQEALKTRLWAVAHTSGGELGRVTLWDCQKLIP